MSRVLYLPSTPLNILVSAAHAVQFHSENEAAICLIDQRNIENNVYMKALSHWSESPFQTIIVLPGQASGKEKLAERKRNFKVLRELVFQFEPEMVATGSDRRIEFQFVMHLLARPGKKVEGIYLDDGLYSYAGKPSKWYKDWTNNWLKKIIYGRWWEEPITVGASSKVHQAWLFSPENSVRAITSGKQVFELNGDMFLHPVIKKLTSKVMSEFNENPEDYQQLNTLFFVAHPNNAAKMIGYEKRLKQMIQEQISQGKRVAIKYHPRVAQGDPFSLMKLGVKHQVPSLLASEFILPILPKKCEVIGDVGTAMLTCHWLRPDLSLKAILSSSDPFQKQFIPLMQAMSIPVDKK